jgi:endonuclease YncB( thermonuclease family)
MGNVTPAVRARRSVRTGRRAARWLDVATGMAFAGMLAAMGGGLVLHHTGGARFVPQAASFTLCHGSARHDCIVDGDTFHFGGDKIRIADIDAPEIFSYKCASELALGNRATTRLLQLMNAGPFTLEPIARDTDVYGRKLRIVRRGGRSIGGELVAEGLARRWDGARHPWC